MPNHFETQDNIEDLEAELKARRQERKQQSALAAANEILDENELYFITRLNVYFLKTSTGWTNFVKDALPDEYPVCVDKNVRDALRVCMKERDRVFHDITYSIKPVPNKLNLLHMSNWIKPEAGEHHWLFDIIIHTLACGQAGKIEHLERLIAFKYSNPDCPTLPALVIHGEGHAARTCW